MHIQSLMHLEATSSCLPVSGPSRTVEPKQWAVPLTALQVWLGIALVVLNLVDAFFTLRHVAHGALELNPLMAELLGDGSHNFVVVKHILVSLGLAGILMRSRSPLARIALPGLVALFSTVIVYHTVLLVAW